MRNKFIILFIFLLSLSPFFFLDVEGIIPRTHDAVLLTEVKAITLRKGEMTNARRTHPIPQLRCIGGCSYEPDVVQCTNVGTDGADVQWHCKADLPSDVKFKNVEVLCEGYNYPDDAYILTSSCGLEYSLEKLSSGSPQNSYFSNGYGASNSYFSNDGESSSIVANFFVIVVIGLLVFLLCCWRPRGPAPVVPGAAGYGASDFGPGYGGGSYGGGYGGGSYGGTGGYGGAYPQQPYASPSVGAGTGFMGGLFTGGLLSYLFRPRTNYNSGYSTGGLGFRTRPSYTNTRPSHSTGSPSSSSFRTASGFAGTTRR